LRTSHETPENQEIRTSQNVEENQEF